jgi:hypothetical protein
MELAQIAMNTAKVAKAQITEIVLIAKSLYS